jgi:hypothetical protein
MFSSININFTTPELKSTTCLKCKINHKTENIYKFTENYSICNICNEAANISEKISNILDDYTSINQENYKSIYKLKCKKCNKNYEIIIIGLRFIGIQDYISLKCDTC